MMPSWLWVSWVTRTIFKTHLFLHSKFIETWSVEKLKMVEKWIAFWRIRKCERVICVVRQDIVCPVQHIPVYTFSHDWFILHSCVFTLNYLSTSLDVDVVVVDIASSFSTEFLPFTLGSNRIILYLFHTSSTRMRTHYTLWTNFEQETNICYHSYKCCCSRRCLYCFSFRFCAPAFFFSFQFVGIWCSCAVRIERAKRIRSCFTRLARQVIWTFSRCLCRACWRFNILLLLCCFSRYVLAV